MTQLRKFRDSISNYIDELLTGLGKRGSTFTDIDAISHDKDSKRFLFQEFKEGTESLHPAQRWTFTELAGLPRCTVWLVRRLPGQMIGWEQFGSGVPEDVISETEYKRRYSCWWDAIDPLAMALVGTSRQRCMHREEFIVDGVCWICSHTRS